MFNLSKRQLIYFAIAIFGIIGPWYYNLQMDNLSQFFTLMWATPLTSSLSADLLAGTLTFFVWLFIEGRRVGIRPWVLVLLTVLTFLVAFGFTFPFFMFLRERALSGDGRDFWRDA